jgi:hypothetical protein
MLPDVAQVKKTLGARLVRRLQVLVDRRAPLMREIEVRLNTEGDRFSYQTHDSGRIVKSEYKAIRAELSLRKTIPSEVRARELEGQLEEASGAIAQQQERMLFTTVSDAVERVGNAIDARGKPFHPSLLHEALRKIWVDFDESGQPILPTIVVHPDMLKKIGPKIKEWEADKKLKAEFDELMAQKREEWLARESNRKLVG